MQARIREERQARIREERPARIREERQARIREESTGIFEESQRTKEKERVLKILTKNHQIWEKIQKGKLGRLKG